jgi:hypothetical protein
MFRISTLLLTSALALTATMVSAHPLGAQARACLSITPKAQEELTAFTSAITAPDPKSASYAQKLGLSGLTPASFVVETNDTVCTAVTDAVVHTYDPNMAVAGNLIVVRAGSRFVVLNPAGETLSKWSVSGTYDDVRHTY